MNVEDDDTEAMEYVLGLMDRDERRRFDAALLDDPALAERVWRTEELLAPLAVAVRERPVQPRVKRGLDARLFGASGDGRRRERRAVRFWRFLAGMFGAAALAGLALVAVLVQRPGVVVPPSADWIAAIVRPDGSVTLARLRADGALVADPFPFTAAGSPELWVVPDGGTPVSLGVLDPSARSELLLPNTVDAFFRPGSQLVITLEPEGGSPTGSPTGPALGAGPLTRI